MTMPSKKNTMIIVAFIAVAAISYYFVNENIKKGTVAKAAAGGTTTT